MLKCGSRLRRWKTSVQIPSWKVVKRMKQITKIMIAMTKPVKAPIWKNIGLDVIEEMKRMKALSSKK